MATTRKQGRAIPDEDLPRLLALLEGADSVELKLTVPEVDQRSTAVAALADGSAGGSDPPGVLLRHAGPDAQRARRRRSCPARAGRRATTRSSSCARSSRPSCRGRVRRSPSLRRRGRRDARRLRLLGLDEGDARHDRRPGGDGRRATVSQAVLEGAARVLRRARARGHRARRPLRAGPDLRAQAEVRARRGSTASWSPRCGCTPTARGILELSTKCAPGGGVPGRRRDEGVPRRSAASTLSGRAADEDAEGARASSPSGCRRRPPPRRSNRDLVDVRAAEKSQAGEGQAPRDGG